MRKTVEIEPERPTPNLQPPLSISAEQVCFVIVKAREFGAKDPSLEVEANATATDDEEIDVLEEYGDDPVVQELTSFIDDLSEDEQVDLLALAWLGRAGGDLDDWSETREEASGAHAPIATHLLGMPQVGDFLEEALSALGYSCDDLEIGPL
jgi:hypothetical protein